MRMTSGHVVNGKIVVDDLEEPLDEGAEVIVGIPGGERELSAEDEAELEERMAAIQRGEFITAEELLQQLRRG
ncbi:MAG: hypothetical protein JOZ54_01310 [Acidobacteria bacterium]|nr:hypothetical protein [Acidobacteriota bacterium]